MLDRLNDFFAELEKRGVQINGEAAFVCNDGVVLFSPNERGAVDVVIIRNAVHIDYTLGITDDDVRIWRAAESLLELGCEE